MTTFFTLPVVWQKLFVVLFVGPLVLSPFLPQVALNIHSSFTIPIGAVLIAAGVLMILLSFFKIGVVPSIKKDGLLITSGTYALVRHPIYSGTLSGFIGLAVLLNALVPLLYFPISVFLYYVMTIYEEKGLVEMYPDQYPLYKTRVRKRIIPYLL